MIFVEPFYNWTRHCLRSTRHRHRASLDKGARHESAIWDLKAQTSGTSVERWPVCKNLGPLTKTETYLISRILIKKAASDETKPGLGRSARAFSLPRKGFLLRSGFPNQPRKVLKYLAVPVGRLFRNSPEGAMKHSSWRWFCSRPDYCWSIISALSLPKTVGSDLPQIQHAVRTELLYGKNPRPIGQQTANVVPVSSLLLFSVASVKALSGGPGAFEQRQTEARTKHGGLPILFLSLVVDQSVYSKTVTPRLKSGSFIFNLRHLRNLRFTA